MKRIFISAMAVCSAFCSFGQTGVAINTTGNAPDASSLLDVSSTEHGVLIPRVTESQKTAIPAPATGLMVFQSDGDSGFWFYTGSEWSKIGDNLGNHSAETELDMTNNKIINVALCTDNLDAANKEYVDSAVSAGGGGGGAISKPEQISTLSSSQLTYSDAVQYCENLTESGKDDWRLPEAGEIQYFAGMSGATTDFLWTKSLTGSQDFATNQNFISVRLTDGKWKFGGVARFFFPSRSVSGSTTSSSFVTVATFDPLTSGNLFVPTSMTWSINSGSCSSNTVESRLKYVFPDGSFYYSSVQSYTCNSTTVLNLTSIPILNEAAAYSKIEVEVRSALGAANKSSSLTIGGYEIALTQKDGTTMYTRCVR